LQKGKEDKLYHHRERTWSLPLQKKEGPFSGTEGEGEGEEGGTLSRKK